MYREEKIIFLKGLKNVRPSDITRVHYCLVMQGCTYNKLAIISIEYHNE